MRSIIWAGAALACSVVLSACGATEGGGTTGTDQGVGGGETGGTPAGGDVATGGMPTGGSGGSAPTGGSGGSAPVGGEPVGGAVGGSGGTPVGGGGAGGEPVGGEPVGNGGSPVGGDHSNGGSGGAGGEPVGGGGGEVPADAGVADAFIPESVCAVAIDLAAQGAEDDGTFQLAISVDGEESQLASSVNGNCEGDGDGPERVVLFTAPNAGRWRFSTREAPDGGFYDTVLYARANCEDAGSEANCNDDNGPRGASGFDLDLQEGAQLFIIVDAFGEGARGTALLVAESAHVVAAGEVCDREGFPRTCADGSVCSGGFEEDAVCVVATAPEVTAVEAYLESEARQLVVLIEGLDPEDNVTDFRIETFDAAGESIESLPVFDEILSDAGAFSLLTTSTVTAGRVVHSLTVRAIDGTGLESEPFAVPMLAEAELAPTGEPCDPRGLSPRCDSREICADNQLGGASCEGFDGTCDEAVADLDAVDPDEAGAYVWDGNTTLAMDVSDVPCAATGAAEQLVRFRAPSAGNWHFVVDPTAGDSPLTDSLIGVRSSCDVVGPGLACDDDIGNGNLGSEVTVELALGERVVLHVEGYGANLGTYRLSATPAPAVAAEAPSLESAGISVLMPGGAIQVTASGQAAEAAVQELRIDLLRGGRLIVFGHGLFLGEPVDAGEAFDRSVNLAASGLPLVALADSARISAVDLQGRRSNVIEVDISVQNAIELARGAVCDVDPFEVGVCAEGDVCLNSDAEAETERTCEVATAECPAAWDASIVDTAGDAPFVIDSDWSQAPSVSEARCARGSGANVDLHSFTAPVAGTWRFETSNLMGADSVLGVRTSCTVSATELACDDDGAGMLASRADVPMEAGETVYVEAHGFNEVGGRYTLTISVLP